MKLLLALLALFVAAPAPAPAAAQATTEEARILSTIERMESAWNSGDFRGYMAGFKDPDVQFVSSGKFQDGWQGTLDHYVRDYGGSAERRGTLHFYDMKVDLLGPDAAMLVGKYRLVRGKRVTEGVNTRLFRKFGASWLITLNHVSAYDVTPTSSVPEAR